MLTGFKTTGFQIETTNTATTVQVDNGTSQMGAGVAWNMGITGAAPCCADALSGTSYINSGRFPNIRPNVDPGASQP